MVIAVSIVLKSASFVVLAAWPRIAAGLFLAGVLLDAASLRASGLNVRRRLLVLSFVNLSVAAAGFAALALGARAAMTWKEGLPWAAHAAAWLLRATGMQADAFNGFVHLTTMAGPLRFAASWDALGFHVLLVMFAVAAATMLFHAPDWNVATRRLLRLTATLWAVALLRFVLWILLFDTLTAWFSHETESLPVTLFIRPLAVAAMFLPFLPALLLALLPASAPDANDRCATATTAATIPPAAWRPSLRRAGAWALLFLLLLFAAWEPRGTPRRGRLLIDGYRARWSPADRPYDRDWYGADSGYNYAVMRRWFDVFYETEVLDGPITEATLDGASVLVAYLPDRPYGADELRRIQSFVHRGGGLLLIGDHTNVFGSTSHLNTLCDRFGMQFRYDVLFDLDTHFFQMFDPPRWPPRLLHGLHFMKLRGAASLRPTALSTRLFMTVDNTKGLPSIYSVGNFYPPPHNDPRMTSGRYAIAAAARAGSGRVVAFADSTIFSNFEIFYPGKYELLLNTAHWLDHRDARWRSPARHAAAMAALLLLLALALWAGRPRAVLAVLTGAVLTLGVAVHVARRAEAAAGAFPELRRPLRGVFFVADAEDPAYILRDFTSPEPFDQRYDVFIQWVLRTGAFSGFRLVPTGAGDALYTHLRDAAEAETALALILRSETQWPYLETIARDRGSRHVLLLFSQAFAQERIASGLVEAGLLADSEAAHAAVADAWPDGETLVEAGGRRLLLVFNAERFSDRRMGITEKVVPDDSLRAHYNQAFALMDLLFARPGEAQQGPAHEHE